jgi:hypothetical protein
MRQIISLYLKVRVSSYQLWELWEKAYRHHAAHPAERRFALPGLTDWRTGKSFDVVATIEDEPAGDVIVLRLVEEDEPYSP